MDKKDDAEPKHVEPEFFFTAASGNNDTGEKVGCTGNHLIEQGD